MDRHVMEKDDVLERYDVPSGSCKDMTRASLARHSPLTPDKGFLFKYGVGVNTSGFHSQKGGDSTNPTYWLRRMGLIESSSPASSAKRSNAPAAEHHTAQIGSPSRARARHVRLPASGARSTSRRHSRSQRAALAAVVVATPAQQASAPPVLATHIAAGVRACTTRAGGEEIDTALMRDVMLAGRSCASSDREAGEAGPRSESEDGVWPADLTSRVEDLPRQGSKISLGEMLGSETGDSSWSLASLTSPRSLASSFSILEFHQGLEVLSLEAAPSCLADADPGPAAASGLPPQLQAPPLQGRGYRAVLLQSDSEPEP